MAPVTGIGCVVKMNWKEEESRNGGMKLLLGGYSSDLR
jgi:hypothetical protein